MPKVGQIIPSDSPAYNSPIVPYWQTRDGETGLLYHGDVNDVLSRMPSKSVHCVITSPPYWGLRDYGIEGQLGAEDSPDCGAWHKGRDFPVCNECFVCHLVEVFRNLRRVLRDDGTVWLNLGSSYWHKSNVSDEDEIMVLRDDLTPDELQYVLSHLSSSLG